MSWMFYVGLIITVADVLVALALTNYGAKTAATSHLNGVECWRRPNHRAQRDWDLINDQPLVKAHLTRHHSTDTEDRHRQ